jgi:acyl-CoA reductase-like NAD-dependent aldehyde dehydrogenase
LAIILLPNYPLRGFYGLQTFATCVYVEQSRYNDVKEAVVEAMQAVKIGPQFEADSQMGPLIKDLSAEAVGDYQITKHVMIAND